MKRIITVLIVSSVSCPVFAGAYVETREAYNTASELHEVILRAGYNFDMGAGLMFTNAYNVGKWDELKHSYSEIEGWYPLFKPTDKLTFQPGGLINDSSAGSGGAVYLDTNYKFTDWFNLTFRYRYNHNNYDTPDYNGQMDKNDTHEFANYWNFKVTDAFFYTFEPHFFQRVNDYHSKNGKDHHWEITNKFSYKIDRNWLPYLELQWLDRWNDYNREQYRIRLGLRYSF
ncbi:porin OmpL [Enterobacter hormaechei]|uniref:porin OmpL n=1 Tax=Enterobacter hormaechei TaxID=158836 RepID=UPI00210EE61B|nr:porin OmpL [Enterobacter hormaechei]MCQ4218904.1 porin OmpL [Enterobacter hormaechei]MCQ4223477.1 porin OmpL [Enterobacter hormaechei]